MEPFSPELLNILVLICLSWAGVTFITAVIILIVCLCKCCSKRGGSRFIKPVRTPSTISIDNHSRTITPVPIKPHPDQEKTRYAMHDILDEHPYSHQKIRSQPQEYMRDDYTDETTTTNHVRMSTQRPANRAPQSVKPMTDIRIPDRQTPYPADVIARDRLMHYTRFSAEKKY